MFQLGNALSLLKLALSTKKAAVTVSNTKASLILCKKLFKQGYISGFFVLNKTSISIILKTYKNTPVIQNVKTYYHAGNNKSYNLNRLKQQLKTSTFSFTSTRALISTSKGILTDKECYLFSVSGFLLSEIY